MPFISPLINFPFLCTPSLNARWISLSHFHLGPLKVMRKKGLIFMHKFLKNFAMTRWFQGQFTHHNLLWRTYKASSKVIFKQKRERTYKLSQGEGGMSPTFPP